MAGTRAATGSTQRRTRALTLTTPAQTCARSCHWCGSCSRTLFRIVGVDLTIDTTNSSEITSRHADGSLDLGLIARNFALIPDPIGTVLSDYAPTGDWGAIARRQNAEIVQGTWRSVVVGMARTPNAGAHREENHADGAAGHPDCLVSAERLLCLRASRARSSRRHGADIWPSGVERLAQ